MVRPNSISVLAIQPPLRWLQPMPNMHQCRQMIEKHVAQSPADLVVLPEVFNGVPCHYDPHAGPLARQFLSTLARACKISVIGGSIDYDDAGTRRNTCFVLDAGGREVGVCHKRILFGEEQGSRQPGGSAGVFELAGVRVAVLICADLWEPSYARDLVGKADLLCVPAKTSVPHESQTAYARQLWYNLALTRAMENGLPIVVSDWPQVRHEAVALVDGTKVRSVHYTSGAASITDPGKRPDFNAIQAKLGAKQTGILAANIDLDAVDRFRDHRRSVGLLPE